LTGQKIYPIFAVEPWESEFSLAAGFLDKSKPPVKAGRKAMDPSGIARLPKGQESTRELLADPVVRESGQEKELVSSFLAWCGNRLRTSGFSLHSPGGKTEWTSRRLPDAFRSGTKLGSWSHRNLLSGLTRGTAMLSSLRTSVVNFLKNEDGPTAVEYAVMLALIIVVCITAITTLGTNANATFTAVGAQVGKTGS